MKAIVIYSSKTGNTKYIAEAIHSTLPEGTPILPIEKAPNQEELQQYNFLALGYWVDKGRADDLAMKYIQNLPAIHLGLFGTLGADPNSPHGIASKEQTETFIPDNVTLCASYLCQGKIDPKILAYMSQFIPQGSSEEAVRNARIEKALEHPNKEDALRAKNIFLQALTQVSLEE